MTDSIEIRLSSAGLRNLPANAVDDDFTFRVGSKQYECPLVIACFLSPRVASIRTNDATACEFTVGTLDDCGYFAQFLSLGNGSRIEVTAENREFFRALSGEL
jgi:hypothetical protein